MKTRRILGLDLGSHTFKLALAEVQESKPLLLQARRMDLPPEAGAPDRASALKSFLEGVDGAGLKEVVSVVDDPFACLRPVTLPPMPASERAQAIRWELQRFLAVPPEQTAVGYEIIGEETADGLRKQRFLAAALPTPAIQEHLSVLSQAGIRPTRLIPKAVALADWMRQTVPSAGEAPVALLEVGASGCEFVVMEKGRPVFCRKVPGGTQALTQQMTGVLMGSEGQVSLTRGEAEAIQRNLGIPKADGTGIGVRGVTGMQLFSLMRASLERLAMEAERSLAFYSESGGRGMIGELILVGGGAHLKGLGDWLKERLGIAVRIPSVFDAFRVADGAVGGDSAAMGLSWVPALGAVLAQDKQINLLPAELKEGLSATLRRVALRWSAATAVVAVILLLSGMRVYRQGLSRQIAACEQELQDMAQAMPGVRAALAAGRLQMQEPDWENWLRRLTHEIPREVYLTDLHVEEGAVLLRGRVRKIGRSSDEVLARFIEALDRGGWAQAALRSSRQMEQGEDLAEFEIGGKVP